MAASSSGGRSDIWQRVDRGKEKNKVEDPAAGSVPAGGDPALLDLSSKAVNEGWIPVVNRKNKKNIDAAAKGKLMRGKDSGRVLDHAARSKGADWRSNLKSGAVANPDRKVFDRRAQRPMARVVINPDSVKRSWLDVCASRRKVSSFLEMNFVSPFCEVDGMMIADVPNSLVDEAAGSWAHTLVGFVLGDVPFYGQILAWARRIWRTKQEVRVFSKENGFFYFQFGNDEDRDAVLRNGPWMFDGRLVVLQRWCVNIGFDRDFLSSAPVWVRIPHLPLHLWSAKILSIITSVIGIPICLDRATASMERIAFARCLVEVNAAAPLVRFVMVRHEDGSKVRVEVEYEGEPPRCCSCLCFGHTAVQCSVGASSCKQVDDSMDSLVNQGKTTGDSCISTGDPCKGSNKPLSCVENDLLAAPSLVEKAPGEKCSVMHNGVVASSMEPVLEKHCNGDQSGGKGGDQCNRDDLGMEGSDGVADSVVNGFVPIVDKEAEGDGCKLMRAEAKCVSTCKLPCTPKLAASSSVSPQLGANCNEGFGREQRVASSEQKVIDDSGTLLTPGVDDGVVLSAKSLVDDCVMGSKSELLNGCVGVLVETVFPNATVASSVFPANVQRPVDQNDPSTNSDNASFLENGSLSGPLGLGVNGPDKLLLPLSDIGLNSLNVPDNGLTGFVVNGQTDLSLQFSQNETLISPLILDETLISPLIQDSRGSFNSPPIQDSRGSFISPPYVQNLEEGVVEGRDDADLASVGFQIGNQILLGDVLNNDNIGDGSDSFNFTKINEAWLLEQEEAKKCCSKTKHPSSSSKIVGQATGTRKSVRFVGGSGPTPPARFRK